MALSDLIISFHQRHWLLFFSQKDLRTRSQSSQLMATHLIILYFLHGIVFLITLVFN